MLRNIPDDPYCGYHVVMRKLIPKSYHVLHVPALKEDRRICVSLLVIQRSHADPKPGQIPLPADAELWAATPIKNLDLPRCNFDSPIDQFLRDTHSSVLDHGTSNPFPQHLQSGW